MQQDFRSINTPMELLGVLSTHPFDAMLNSAWRVKGRICLPCHMRKGPTFCMRLNKHMTQIFRGSIWLEKWWFLREVKQNTKYFVASLYVHVPWNAQCPLHSAKPVQFFFKMPCRPILLPSAYPTSHRHLIISTGCPGKWKGGQRVHGHHASGMPMLTIIWSFKV